MSRLVDSTTQWRSSDSVNHDEVKKQYWIMGTVSEWEDGTPFPRVSSVRDTILPTSAGQQAINSRSWWNPRLLIRWLLQLRRHGSLPLVLDAYTSLVLAILQARKQHDGGTGGSWPNSVQLLVSSGGVKRNCAWHDRYYVFCFWPYTDRTVVT